MCSILQLAAFLSICCLIPGAVTHTNQKEDKRFKNEISNQNSQEVRDFYFEEQKTNDDNIKTGRVIPQTAWSKEDKRQIQPVENETGAQLSDEFSFKNALSYLLNMLHELKKDIFGIKEMTSLKNTKDLTNSEDNVRQNKMGEKNDAPPFDSSTKNPEFEETHQKPKSNYIIDYYQKNGIKFFDDDLETSSDESDDSSHIPNEDDSLYEVSRNDDKACMFECSKLERMHDRYSETEETTTISTSQTKVTEENIREYGDTKDDKKDYVFKESTTKSSETKKLNSNTSGEEAENTTMLKTGKCVRKNNDNFNNLNEFTEKPLKSGEIPTSRPQIENFNEAKSELSNKNKTSDNQLKVSSSSPDSRKSGTNSQYTGGSDFDSKSVALGQSTTLPSQNSKDDIYPDIIVNKPNASGMSSGKSTNKDQQEQIISLKPEEQDQDDVKSQKNNEGENKYTTESLQSQDAESTILYHEVDTDTEIKDNPKESKGERLNSSHTTITYTENNQHSKSNGQQISNIFVTGNTISPTTSVNILNAGNLKEDPSENLDGKKEMNESEKSNTTQQAKNDSEITQRDSETEQSKTQQLSYSEPEKSLKNKDVNALNRENNNKEEDDNLTSMKPNELPSVQDSNSEIQNPDVEALDKIKEANKYKESLNKKDGTHEISPDQEYEYDDENEDFDISDELTDKETDRNYSQNQEGELITNNRDEENDDEMNPGNIATVLTKESQHEEYMTEENPKERYDTFLEYFYKHSNSSFFQSLKSQSNNFSR